MTVIVHLSTTSSTRCTVEHVWLAAIRGRGRVSGRLAEEKPVLGGDMRWNRLRPDAVTTLLEAHRPHHIHSQRAVYPP